MYCAKLSRPARSRPCRRTSPSPPCAASAASNARVGEGNRSWPFSASCPSQSLASADLPMPSVRSSGTRWWRWRRGPMPSHSPCPRSSASPSSPCSTTSWPVTTGCTEHPPVGLGLLPRKSEQTHERHFSSPSHIFFLKTL